MVDSIVTWITELLSGVVSKELIVFIISLLPILELRGGLIAASLFRIEYLEALIICVIGNIIPIPFILLFINKIFAFMKRKGIMSKLIVKLENKSMNKSDKIKKYEFLGLVLFVGIPLPGTGAWTGSLIAALLGVDFKKAIAAILLGVLMAAAIMSIITYVLLGAIGY